MRMFAGFVLIAFAACRSQVAKDTLRPRDAAAISPDSGAVSIKLVADPDSPDVHLGPGEEYVAPQLHPSNPQPVYPSALVTLRLKPYTVSLRVTFNERGQVLNIDRSPVSTSTDGEHQAAFESAARDAVSGWKIYPPSIRKFRNGPDADGDGKPDFRIMSDHRLLKTFFDFSFGFEVVNGVPVVRRSV